MDAVAKGDVESQLRHLTVDGQAVAVGAGVRHQCKSVRAGLHHVTTGGLEQRADRLAAVEEELQRGQAGPANRSVPCGITRMRWCSLGDGLRQQVGSELREDLGYCLRIEHVGVERARS